MPQMIIPFRDSHLYSSAWPIASARFCLIKTKLFQGKPSQNLLVFGDSPRSELKHQRNEGCKVAIDDDGSEQAIGAEKSPRNVRRFIWAALLGIVILLALVLLFFHVHTPIIEHSLSFVPPPLSDVSLRRC
jgi:hypothetical protein